MRFLTDINGVVTDTFDYEAFGDLIARGGATPNLYQHRGEQFDPELNLYYLRARYHNPATGRFWNADTFEGFLTDPASLHAYTYNQNDPVNRADPSGHLSVNEAMMTSTLAPMVRGTLRDLWDGVNNFSYGMSGGNALKFTSREEAYFIDSLAAGPGFNFGRDNFWAAARGAPFLLNQNPNIWQGKKPCYYECVPFDLDAPVYGPGAQHPLFEFEESPLYGLAEKIGYYSTAPVRFLGGAAVSAGVTGKSVADLLVNTGGAVLYGVAANAYGRTTAEQFFGKQADATAALTTGLGRLGVAAGTFNAQPLLNVLAPEFASEQRSLLGQTASGAFNGFTGGDEEFAGMGWEFRSGYTLFNLLTAIQGTAEISEAIKVARAARLSSRLLAAESVSQMSAVRALRVNATTTEALEAASALTGPAKSACRRAPPNGIIDLVEGPDGVYAPVTELKNQILLAAPPQPKLLAAPAAEKTAKQLEFDFVNSLSPKPSINWAREAPNRGFAGAPAPATLVPGTLIDRFGYPGGTFVSTKGTPFIQRSLAPGTQYSPYNVYLVLKPIDVNAGQIAPAFGMPGKGMQFQLPSSVQSLIDSGHLGVQ